MTIDQQLILVAGQEEHAVLAAEAEAVGQGVLEIVARVLVGADIQVDAFVLVEHVLGRMDHLVLQRLHGRRLAMRCILPQNGC